MQVHVVHGSWQRDRVLAVVRLQAIEHARRAAMEWMVRSRVTVGTAGVADQASLGAGAGHRERELHARQRRGSATRILRS